MWMRWSVFLLRFPQCCLRPRLVSAAGLTVYSLGICYLHRPDALLHRRTKINIQNLAYVSYVAYLCPKAPYI